MVNQGYEPEEDDLEEDGPEAEERLRQEAAAKSLDPTPMPCPAGMHST